MVHKHLPASMYREDSSLSTNDLKDLLEYLTALTGYITEDEILSASVKEKRIEKLDEIINRIDNIVALRIN